MTENFLHRRNFSDKSTKNDGGINVYTGMDNDGSFFIGNKKVSSATGQEEVFDAPIPSVTGEDVGDTGVSVGFDVLTPLEITISRSIKVEGGPDGSIISEFDGPVIFNDKITLPLLVVSKRTPCSYRVIPPFLESTRLVLLNPLLLVTPVTLYTLPTQPRVDTSVGYIPLTMSGSDLVM